MKLRVRILLIALATAPSLAPAAPTAVSVDFNARGRPISPLIFGVSFGDAARNAQIGYTLDRWGGNSVTRYNWQADIHNTASDWYFENVRDCTAPGCIGTPPAGNSADTFIASARNGGAQALITIPTIGWTPRSDSPATHPFLAGFSTMKYGAQLGTDTQWDPTAGNGTCGSGNKTGHCVGGRIVGNDPADTSSATGPADAAAWIAHLQSVFGNAASGGVKFYALDNELMLWNSTHRDVHPLPVTFDDAWANTLQYASAIKQQEPDAKVTGPVTWGYCDLFGSAADNCAVGNDRTAHAGMPFVAWYLQQVCANPLAGGKHLVDYLDLHYYPQNPNGAPTDIVGGADDAATAARRLRSLKELYDPAWVSESWFADLGDSDGNHYSKPGFIPRVRAWINEYCPGTKLAITEYNWGGDDTASGAVAQAEALAIFAREGVDLAARWGAPAESSKVERAFQLFLNYDGAGHGVAGEGAAAASADRDLIGAYAFRLYGRRNMLLLTNKDTSATHSVALTFAQSQRGAWTLYGFDPANGLRSIGSGSDPGAALTLDNLPALSASLLVLSDDDGLFRDGFD
ncbi:MAG TPA: glycoside hydrolase family 44 protein [Rudaea sp.]|nr:glycoside hydrolase family 44 protein [Rudaea sp.]